MRSEDRVYDTLEDKSIVILNNLDKLPDEKPLQEILDKLEGTTCANHINIYKLILEFYKANKKFPDIQYIISQFGGLVKVVEEPNFTLDFVTGFLGDIDAEKLSADIRLAAIEHRFDAVEQLAGKWHSARTKLVEFTPTDALKEYDVRRSNPAGIRLGVPELDELTNGICYGNPCIVGGGPGSGKTTFAISATYGALRNRFNCAYITTELSQTDLLFNFLSRHSYEMGYNLKADRIKKAILSDAEHETLLKVTDDWMAQQESGKMGKLRIYQGSDFTPFSPIFFKNEITKLKQAWGELDMLVLDYIQNCVVWKADPRQDPAQFLNGVVEFLRSFTIDFEGRGLVLMLLSQLNREGMKKVARSHCADLTCFAELNSLERCAHTAIVIHSDAASKLNGQTLMQIVKNRSGEVMPELRTINFEPAYFMVGGESVGTVINEASLDDMTGDVGFDESMI